MREKENIFNEFMTELRKKERENKTQILEKARKEFQELLKESHEKKPFERNARWSEVKESIRSDPRYKQLESSSDKESHFKSFMAKVAVSASDLPEDKNLEDAKEREKQERIAASIRERELEVEKLLSTQEKEREKERNLHRHKEAVETMTALLMDIVRSSDFSWRDAKKVLKKDKRMEIVEDFLDRDEREKLFNEHIDRLLLKKKEKFREMLSEIKELDLTTTWRDVRRQIKDDPRFLKFSSSDRKCEREFREYSKDKLTEAKKEFREFLTETKILTYKSKKMIDESDQHLQDIIAVLQNDKRYLILECYEDERREILMGYIDELERKGPPPPPTASEPTTARKK